MTPLERFRMRADAISRRCCQDGDQDAASCIHEILIHVVMAMSERRSFSQRLASTVAAENIAVNHLARIPTLRREIIRIAIRGLKRLVVCMRNADPDVSALAVAACEDETALFPLRDRLEELGLDASLLTCLLPPRPAPVVVEDESGIPY